jgi:hypothetical protein
VCDVFAPVRPEEARIPRQVRCVKLLEVLALAKCRRFGRDIEQLGRNLDIFTWVTDRYHLDETGQKT